MARSLALDLTPENIFITEIMPGITDTGFYDNPKTLKYIKHASKELGYDYTDATFPVFSAERAGEAVVLQWMLMLMSEKLLLCRLVSTHTWELSN